MSSRHDSPGQRPAAPRRGGHWLLVLAAVVAGMALVMGLVAAASLMGSRTQVRELEAPGASAARARNECGPITVRRGDAGSVSARASMSFVLRAPSVAVRDERGVAVIEADCPALGIATSVSLSVVVPPDAPVDARSSAGAINAEGLSGAVDLTTSAGSITGRELAATDLSADTSAGSVSLAFAASADPRSVRASSSAGSVTVEVADRPGVAYRVDADSSAGSVDVAVRTDPTSERSITARSSAGSDRVRYR